MKLNRFALAAWGLLAYNLLVILWGAYVRATGSGAGCGAHWPTCNGEIIPRAPAIETMIEFTHRLMSGFALLLVIGLFIWAVRLYPKGHIVRTGASFSLFFTITEALVGAGLVLFGLVADNPTLTRAFSMMVHLVNTFLLLAAITLTAWWASGGSRLQLMVGDRMIWVFAIGWLGMLFLGASGAVTALGDTLFPARSLAEGIQQDFSPTAHFLIRLRLFHPLIAVSVGAYITLTALLVWKRIPSPPVRKLAALLTGLFLVQLGLGLINVILLAPVWMQLVHLLAADLVWISFVLLTAAALERIALQEPAQGGKYAAAVEKF